MGAPDRHARARTRPGRLAAWDRFLLETELPLLRRAGTLRVCDVGFGETPITTREWAQALWGQRPDTHVLGLEREPGLVMAARQAAADPRLDFVEGGFDALVGLSPLRVVRAANVLRAYPGGDLDAAWAALGAGLEEGGVVLEGTTDVEGAVGSFVVLRRRGGAVTPEALVFHADGRRAFAPRMLRDVLPRAWRRGVGPDHPVLAFLSRWHEAHLQALRAGAVAGLHASSSALGADVDVPIPGVVRWRPHPWVPAEPQHPQDTFSAP